jgi:hypothetical protein
MVAQTWALIFIPVLVPLHNSSINNSVYDPETTRCLINQETSTHQYVCPFSGTR